ncbi:amidohydrolase [Prolixibacteraceae bacterium JC049]|nr:amidohydrolase [Prolixibacteraceae bacterium JC049]
MKKILLLSLGIILGIQVLGQTNTSLQSIHQDIQDETNRIFEELVEFRRDIHMHPELSEQEKRTSGKITSYLKKLGLDVKTNIGGYGVVGILHGAKDGKHIAWRADIDAFKSDFPDVVEFASKNKGVRHICGHDVHTTIGLGIANVLSKQKEQVHGTIYFIFQPAEEILNKGAESMISDSLFDIIHPTEIYALHMNPLPVGMITSKPNELYSYFRNISIKYNNIQDKEAVTKYTQQLIQSFNTVDQQFWDTRNISNPQIGVGNPNSIYKDYLAVTPNFNNHSVGNTVELTFRIYASNKTYIDALPENLEEKITQSKYAKNLIAINYEKQHPTVLNNPDLTEQTLKSIASIYGSKTVIPTHGIIHLFNDDFSYFQQKVPGVYFLMGGSNFQKGIIAMPHTPNFNVDEESIRIGVNYFSSMLVERLNR